MRRYRLSIDAKPEPIAVTCTIDCLGPAPRSFDDWYLVRPDDGEPFHCIGGEIIHAEPDDGVDGSRSSLNLGRSA